MSRASERLKRAEAFQEGRMSQGRWAWLRFGFSTIVTWIDYKVTDGEVTDEIGDISLYFNIGKNPRVRLELTTCTEQDLVALKNYINEAIDWALPIARQRDKEASDALDAGDDSYARIYRPVPELVYRKRPKQQHGEGVHDGPSDDAGLLQDGEHLDGDVRAPGSEVAERDA